MKDLPFTICPDCHAAAHDHAAMGNPCCGAAPTMLIAYRRACLCWTCMDLGPMDDRAP